MLACTGTAPVVFCTSTVPSRNYKDGTVVTCNFSVMLVSFSGRSTGRSARLLTLLGAIRNCLGR